MKTEVGHYDQLTLRRHQVIPDGTLVLSLGARRGQSPRQLRRRGPFTVRSAASMRFIVELSDPPRAMGSLPGGQRDQEYTESPKPIDQWVAGMLRPMHFSDAALEPHEGSAKVLVW